MRELSWVYFDNGVWEAFSAQNCDGCLFMWRITVNHMGMFCVDDSDSELTDRTDPFNSLAEAKAFCQASENVFNDTRD